MAAAVPVLVGSGSSALVVPVVALASSSSPSHWVVLLAPSVASKASGASPC